MAVERDYLEDFAIGEVIRSPARTITQADIHAFAALTGDWNPLHTDIIHARQGHFGAPIAHGLLILSVGSALAYRLGEYAVLPRSFIAFYGIRDLRFTAPVMIDDTIHLTIKITDIVMKDAARGLIVGRNEVANQNDKPVCVFTTEMLCGRRPVEPGQSNNNRHDQTGR